MSAFAPISVDEVAELTKPKPDHNIPEQVGPIIWYDKEMLCEVETTSTLRGITMTGTCRSPTYTKVQGTPMCMMHALRKANELLVEAGIA